MFQREFALRLVARPGDPLYCRLSVNAQFWARITHIMKVGKNNFRPPPQVESSVVRIEPKVHGERPRVSWEEWDGMLRICFIRRNRTLRASWLGSKKVLALCEKNFRVWCALNDVVIDEGGSQVKDRNKGQDTDVGGNVQQISDDEEWGGIDMDFAQHSDEGDNGKTEGNGKTTGVAKLVREKIQKVLAMTGLADKRAGQCEEGDFLKLLLAFNEEGIHFT
jgi:18S rRNA (adenine1779-N6/adenine1780-N6)-dimethyltransferase